MKNSKTIDRIKREDYILLDGERVVVTRVTSKEIAERHDREGVTVYVVKDTEDGFLAAIPSADYKGRTSKKQALIDKLVARGISLEDAIELLG